MRIESSNWYGGSTQSGKKYFRIIQLSLRDEIIVLNFSLICGFVIHVVQTWDCLLVFL